ncbi:sulfotransferase [Candidatus Marinimicrobia bacterium]|nr:sulfotransferase [Candidatus Neomarinimicrobiota bacterium]
MNKSLNIDKPIFLIGFPRSGTTLLNLILSSHSLIELKNNDDILMVFHDKSLNPFKKIDDLVFSNLKMEDSRVDFNRFIKTISKSYFEKLRKNLPIEGWDLFKTLLNYGSNGKPFWGSKTHHYMWFYNIIIEKYSKSNFIILIRDPRAVILSNYIKHITSLNNHFANTHNYDLNLINYDKARSYFIKLAHHWVAWHKKVINIVQNSKYQNIHYIKYEDLVLEPEKNLKILFTQLNIKYENDIINSDKRFHHPIANNESITYAHSNLRKPLNISMIDKWKHIEKKLILIIEHICKDVMEYYKYECTAQISLGKSLYFNNYLDYKYKYQSDKSDSIESIIISSNNYCSV